MSKIGRLVRVSSKDQNPEGQYEAIRKWLTENGQDESGMRWYEDRETGKHLNRKGFLRLQKDVGAGRVTTIIRFHLDRVARNMLDGMITVAGWLEKDVRIVVLTPGFEVKGIMGKAMSTMLFMFAEMEMEWRRRRQAEGILVAKKLGKYRGRLPGTTKAQPRRARQLRERGLKLLEIATAMGVSKSTVIRYLR